VPTKTHFLEITKYPQTQMAQISVSLSDDLVAYLDRKVENPSVLIESIAATMARAARKTSPSSSLPTG
jgi:hypothetical protein